MPFNSNLSIICGAARGTDGFAVALSDLDLDRPASIILTYREGGDQPWARYDFQDVVRSMTRPPRDVPKGCEYVALSDEGAVLFLNGDMFQEAISGAGVWSDNADGSGAMSAIGIIDGRLTATGDSGQVYGRRGQDNWVRLFRQPLSAGPITTDFRTFASLRRGSTIYGGPVSVPLSVTAEMEAAEAAGDFELYQRLVMAQNTGGGSLWVHDNEWQMIELSTNGVPAAMLSRGKAGALIAFDAGFVARMDVAQDIEYSDDLDPARVGEIVSMVDHEGTVVVATELSLFRLEFPGFADFSPKLPETVHGIVSLSSADGALWLFDDQAVFRLDDEAWREVEIPASLLATPFNGL